MFWARNVLAALLENVNGLAFVLGACWCYLGLAGVSRPAANIVAGALVMAIGAYPYLKRRKKP